MGTFGWSVLYYMPSFSSEKFKKIKQELKEEECFKEICNSWNSKQKSEIPALLQGGSICLVSPVTIKNDRTRTEGRTEELKKE